MFQEKKGSMGKQEMVMNVDDDSSDLIESFERELKGTDFEKEFLSLNKTLSDEDNDASEKTASINANDKSQNKRSKRKTVQSVPEDSHKKCKRISIDFPLEVHTKLNIVKSITHESLTSIISHALDLVLAEYEKNNSDIRNIFSQLRF